MRPEVEAALADQFGRPIPLVLVVDGSEGTAPEPVLTSDRADDRVDDGHREDDGSGAPPPTRRPAEPDDLDEDLSAFDTDNLEVAEIDNSAEARLLQAFPGAEEVV
jgi:hypothetical protein